jgi:outer membrane protein OmpA-like peptidoglycan-associated protein
MIQYERDPLILYEEQDEIGAVVARRMAVYLGASADLGGAVALRAVVPSALQWRTEVPDLSQDGPVFGDVSIGARARVLNSARAQAGISADLIFPSGTRQAWMGEGQVRGRIGGMGQMSFGRFDALADLGLAIRPTVPTQQDFILGSEVLYAVGARYHAWPGRTALALEWVARKGLDSEGFGGAENPSELLAVAQITPRQDLAWDIGVGKGVAEGYGTTELRAIVGLTWVRHPPPPEPLPHLVIADVPDEAPEEVIPPDPPDPPEPVWEEKELAKVQGEQIVIREPIAFEFNTPNILPESLPTLRYVAGLLNDNWQIAHLVIEGHASDEGSFVYNYDLSIRRSRAIWEELLRAGVHPDRMSYRGMGEVVPKRVGGDEASLAANRRVEFKIVKQFGPDERPPPYREDVRFPWDGEAANVHNPEPPPEETKPEARERPEAEERVDMEQFFDDIEAEMDDKEAGESPPPSDPSRSEEQAP